MSDEQTISPHEAALIVAFTGSEELTLEELAKRGEIEVSQARSAVERLKFKDAIEQTKEVESAFVSLTDAGVEARAKSIPELRLWATLAEQGATAIKDLQQRDDMERSEAGAAFGALKGLKALSLDKGQASLVEGADRSALDGWQALVEKVGAAGSIGEDELSEEERKRLGERRMKGYFKRTTTRTRSYRLTAAGEGLRGAAARSAEELSSLTSEMLRDGSWQGKDFRRYSIGLPPRLVGGYRNSYKAFLDRVKTKLLGLGFEEMRGSLVENEFWNMDALFLPQFHPARDIHDVYFIEDPTHSKEIAEPHLSRIAGAHEGTNDIGSRGWGYVFDRERTKRLVLRSQGTALSARQLGKDPKIPGKYFSIARCFRYDTVDYSHAPDFFQIEGIVLSPTITFRHLLGMLQVFAKELAEAKEVRAVPAYFPFTEPSVEIHMKHPTMGWMELGGAGIFRPEVSQSLGVDCPVIAWGLGLDRMAMVALGIKDIRELFTNNQALGLAANRPY